MPLQRTSHNYNATRGAEIVWDNFKGGLNVLLKETELKANELAQADNILLTGSGVPTRRWGSDNYFMAGPSGSVRGMKGYYKSDGTNELIALTDSGLLTKKSLASYEIITGASWVSGYDAEMTQLNDNLYIVNGVDTLKKYAGANVVSFTTLSIPANVKATNISGVSGTFTYSWRISAESEIGETIASTSLTLGNLPEDLTQTVVQLSWGTSVPTASVRGYVIYGREQGQETFLSRIGAGELNYFDNGTDVSSLLSEPPTADSTGGPIAKYVIKYDNRLIIGGMSDHPSRVMFSGKNQNSERFHWSQGGGYIDVDVDGGDNITGLGIFQEKIIIFKERSIWQLTIDFLTMGNWTVADPSVQAITTSHGAVSNKTIVPVENDVFLLTRNGVYVLGYEPNILNTLRTNEVSARVRPLFDNIAYDDLKNASAEYIDKKYVLSFPSVKKTFSYDRERLAWTGPWVTPFGIREWHTYYDGEGKERWLAGDSDDSYVSLFGQGYTADKGTAFNTILRTRKEAFGNWGIFKTIDDLIMNFKSVSGMVDVNIKIEERDGSTVTAKNFTIASASVDAGWGADMFGNFEWGDTEESGSISSIDDLIRRAVINKTARSIQLDIRTTDAGDNYELLGVRINAKPQGKGSIPLSWSV